MYSYNGKKDLRQDPRSAQRQDMVQHLAKCGARAILEAFIAVEAGRAVDEVLVEYQHLPQSVFKALGADRLPIGSAIPLTLAHVSACKYFEPRDTDSGGER
jgi:hypothetical protein